MLGGKPSTKLHEVIERKPGHRFTYIVYAGPKSACNAWWLKQPAERRQFLTVQIAGR